MNRFIFCAIVLIALAVSANETRADFKDGNDILRDCSDIYNGRILFCYGYIDATADALNENNVLNSFRACVPGQVEASQLKDIVIQFLYANPTRRHFGATGLVAHAISDAFPCPR